MLNDYVPNHRLRQRLQEVIAVSHLDEFTNWLAGLRYAKATIRSLVPCIFWIGHAQTITESCRLSARAV